MFVMAVAVPLGEGKFSLFSVAGQVRLIFHSNDAGAQQLESDTVTDQPPMVAIYYSADCRSHALVRSRHGMISPVLAS